eukprot:3366351-Rhodomonas_salina.1
MRQIEASKLSMQKEIRGKPLRSEKTRERVLAAQQTTKSFKTARAMCCKPAVPSVSRQMRAACVM